MSVQALLSTFYDICQNLKILNFRVASGGWQHGYPL